MSLVLVVEDDPFSMFTITEMLEELGHAWISAANGREGLERLNARAAEVAVVLMDVHMPEVSGLEAVRAIRRAPDDPPRDLPVVAISADPVWQSQEHVRAAGFDMALAKPISMNSLLKTLSRYTHG